MADNSKPHNNFDINIEALKRRIAELEKAEAEFKAVEQLNRENEERYRLLTENISDVIWTMDKDFRFTYVTPSVKKLTGYDVEEIIGRPLKSILTPESYELAMQAYKETLRLSKEKSIKPSPPRTLELSQKNKDGQVIISEARLTSIKDENGEIVGFLGITRDITERRQALEAVKKSEQQLRQFIEDAGEPMMSVDNEGRIILASKRVANYLGLKMDEVVGKTLWDVFSKDFDGSGISEMKEAIENKNKFSREYQVVFNGERKWYEIIVQPLTPISGINQVAQVIAHDVTETVKAKTRDRARIGLLNNLRSVNDIDNCLECGCRAIKDSQHYRRAVMTLHNEQREIINLGHIGLEMAIVEQARNGRAPDEKVRRSIMQDKYRISRSYFIPAEANLQLDKSERYIPPDTNQNCQGQAWKNGDEFFIPILSDNNECEGWLSVDTPYDDRRPNIVTALFLEEIVDIVTKKIHEISIFHNLQGKGLALEESNIALRTVLANIEHDKAEIRGKVSQFINDIILPAVDRLANADGSVNKIQYTALKNGLFELISAPEISMQSYPQLSPRELEISMMIKDGFNSKEISKSLRIALKTVHKHRQFIRQKLGIDKQKINLTTYLSNNQIYRQQ